VNATIPRMGAPSSRAVFAVMTTWIPAPYQGVTKSRQGAITQLTIASIKPARVVVVGRDISVGSRPMANSVSALLVAFMLPNSYEPSSERSSRPPASITLALPDKRVSHAISSD
jgi:hypothetical protein